MTYTINGAPATGIAATRHFVEWFLSLAAEPTVVAAGLPVDRTSNIAVTIFSQGAYNYNLTIAHHRAARGLLKSAGIVVTDASELVARIMSGSCTPACDLVKMVDDGEITAVEATQALRASGRKVSDVHSEAAAEVEYMRRMDI